MYLYKVAGIAYSLLGGASAYFIYLFLFISVAGSFGGHVGKLNLWPYLSIAFIPIILLLIGILLFIGRQSIRLFGIAICSLQCGLLAYLSLVVSNIQNIPGKDGNASSMSIKYGLIGYEIIVTKEMLASLITFLFIATFIALFSFLKLPNKSLSSATLMHVD